MLSVVPNSLEGARPTDCMTRLATSDLGRAYKSLVVEEMRIRSGDFVVDLGCGPGADLARFADAVGPSDRVLQQVTGASAVVARVVKLGGRLFASVPLFLTLARR